MKYNFDHRVRALNIQCYEFISTYEAYGDLYFTFYILQILNKLKYSDIMRKTTINNMKIKGEKISKVIDDPEM